MQGGKRARSIVPALQSRPVVVVSPGNAAQGLLRRSPAMFARRALVRRDHCRRARGRQSQRRRIAAHHRDGLFVFARFRAGAALLPDDVAALRPATHAALHKAWALGTITSPTGEPPGVAMSEPTPLHQLFGLSWIDFFEGRDVTVEMEVD